MTTRTVRYRAAERHLFHDAGIEPREHEVRLASLGGVARVLEVGDGPPLVFMHGGPNAAATWAYVAARLPGRRCLLVDRPGCGLSGPPPFVPDADTLPDYGVCLVRDLLDGMALPSAALVGSSLGGCLALRAAIAFPDRVDAVALVGCPAFVPGWRAPSFFWWLRAPIVGRLVLAAPVTAAAVRASLAMQGHRRALADDVIPAPMLAWIGAWQADTDTMAHESAMIVACGTWLGGFDPRLDLTAAELARVHAPVHILVGDADPVGGEDVARRLARSLTSTRSTVEVFADAGHLPWLDDPVRVAAGLEGLVVDRFAGELAG